MRMTIVKRLRRHILPLVALFLFLPILAGCVTTIEGPSYQETMAQTPALAAGMTRLFFLRSGGVLGSGGGAQVHINGIQYLDLGNGGFGYADVKAGKTIVMVDGPTQQGEWSFGLDTLEGKEHYFRVSPNLGRSASGFALGVLWTVYSGTGPYQIDIMQEDTAQAMLPSLKLSM